MRDVSGVTGAAPVWRDVMDFLQQGAQAYSLPPPGVVRRHIVYAKGIEPGRDEWFLAGTETEKLMTVKPALLQPRMTTPANGAIYAIDPDIPKDNQRIAVTARGVHPGTRFVLDDGRRVRADTPFLWLPPPGERHVALIDSSGKELDRVRFEVRGINHLAASHALTAAKQTSITPD